MDFNLKLKKIVRCLGGFICFLILANIIGLICRHGFDVTSSYTIQLFNLAEERNIPTVYSGLQLLVCAGLLGLIATARKRMAAKDYWYWLGLAGLFLFLSFDELIEIHERIALITRNQLNTTGMFYFAWIIPYALLVVAVAAVYVPFLLKLPKSIKILMGTAGVLFVAAALGMEALESHYHWETQGKDLNFAIMVTIEEAVEMLSILLFLIALLRYIKVTFGGMSLHINENRQAASKRKSIGVQRDKPFSTIRDRTPVQAYNTYKSSLSDTQQDKTD